MTVPLESADEFIALSKVDWLVAGFGRRLHAVRDEAWTDEHRTEMEQEWVVWSPVRLACGRMAACVSIPGLFTRMGAERCRGCCRALGYPIGRGSPKNCDAIRVLLGLPTDGGGMRALAEVCTFAAASLPQLFVRRGESCLLVVGAVVFDVGPHQVEQVPRPGHPPALAHLAEREPCLQRHAETLDRRFVARFRCCHMGKLSRTGLRCHTTGGTVVT